VAAAAAEFNPEIKSTERLVRGCAAAAADACAGSSQRVCNVIHLRPSLVRSVASFVATFAKKVRRAQGKVNT
jgi:hypothetical protein